MTNPGPIPIPKRDPHSTNDVLKKNMGGLPRTPGFIVVPQKPTSAAHDWPNKENSQNKVGSSWQSFVDVCLTPTVLQWSSPHELSLQTHVEPTFSDHHPRGGRGSERVTATFAAFPSHFPKVFPAILFGTEKASYRERAN